MGTWIEDEKARARFWARAHELGFEHDAVHAALNVTSLKEFKGTEAEAVSTLTALKAERDKTQESRSLPPSPLDNVLQPAAIEAVKALREDDELAAAYTITCQSLPEAPALGFTKFQTQSGFVWSVTLRAGMPPLLENAAMGSIARQIEAFEKGALAHGWQPISDGRDTAMGLKPRAESAASPAPAPQNGKPVAPPLATGTPPPQAAQGGALTFNAEKLTATVTDGKTYWKVKGGQFSQYGVTVWPEVLQDAGFSPDDLNPTTVYSLNGYRAHYALNDKGKAGKVTLLELITQ